MEILEIEVTCPDEESARDIAKACLRAHLIACANLLPKVESLFCWQGQIDSESEVLLRMKARASHFERVAECIRHHHPYSLPAIIALPVSMHGPGVAEWVASETKGAQVSE